MLSDATFAPGAIAAQIAERPAARTMSYGGTIAKSLVLLTMTFAFAAIGWLNTDVAAVLGDGGPGLLWFLGYLVLIGMTVAAAANPSIAPAVGVVYSIVMGLWVGYVSKVYSVYWDGIVALALLASLGTVLATLLLYLVGAIRVTRTFVRVVSGALLGLVVTYLISWVLALFGADLSFLYGPTTTGIAFSLLICVLAAATLATDFEFIRQGVERGAPASMEWYAAFGLVSTLVWLYVEILRLLALLARNR
jgi:uncharacterized YccA/Bax inhibitor family protein